VIKSREVNEAREAWAKELVTPWHFIRKTESFDDGDSKSLCYPTC